LVAKLGQADEALAKRSPIAEVARSLGVSAVTLHSCARCGAMERGAVRRMKGLEKEKARLKRLVKEKEPDIQILKEVAKGDSEPGAAAPRDRACDDGGGGVGACRTVGQHRSTQRRRTHIEIWLVSRMRELAVANPRRGRRHTMDLLRQERWSIGARLMKRLWSQEGLLVPGKRAKRRRIGTSENGIVRRRATRKNEV